MLNADTVRCRAYTLVAARYVLRAAKAAKANPEAVDYLKRAASGGRATMAAQAASNLAAATQGVRTARYAARAAETAGQLAADVTRRRLAVA